MTFFLDKTVRISSDYHAKRNNSYGEHRAWDFISTGGQPLPIGTPIVAPEDGEYHFQVIVHKDHRVSIMRPDRTWWPYGRYYYEVYGGMLILFGKTYTHVFAHLSAGYIFGRWHAAGMQYEQPKIRVYDGGQCDYTKYVLPRVNWTPIWTAEGQEIGQTGDDGYSTMEHLHYQTMQPGGQVHKHVDPATIFPDEYRRLCL